ncbi:unnamed protein product [Caenorhabditis brenneri]
MDDMKHQIIAFLEQTCNDFRLSPMSDLELAERFNLFNHTRYDVDLLAAQFQNTRKLILKNQSTSIFFKIGLLFVSQEVVSTAFEQSLSLQNICTYKLDTERKLISFYPKRSTSGRGFEREGNGYSHRNFTCPINRLPWNIYETTKLFNFIQSRARGTPFHVKLEDLMKTFKEKEASRRTVEQLVAKATQYLTRDIDTVKWMTLGVKAQIIYTLQIPLSPVFLNELYRNARFQVKDGKLSYFRMGNLTVGRENDELITRVPKKLFHVFLEHMAKQPGLMRVDDLAEEFVREFEHYATKDMAVGTILKMLDTRFSKLTLDPITRICIFFKTQIHMPLDFDNYLQKCKLGELEVDEGNKIKSFVSNDGTINLNIENEVPLENNCGRKRTLAVALGEGSADTPASKKRATHSPMSNDSADDVLDDDYDEEVDPSAADLPGTSFEISSQCQNLLQRIETQIQSNQNEFCFVEPKEEKDVNAYQDSSNVPGTSLSSTCQNLLEQINASIEDQVQVTGPEVPDYTFIMPKQENIGSSYDRNLSNYNKTASMPVRNAPSSAPTTANFVNNEPEYDEADLVPLTDVKQEEDDESDDEIPTYDLNPAAAQNGNPPPPQKVRPVMPQTRVSQVMPSRPLIPAANRRPMYHPSQSQAASYKEILQWLQTSLKTLSAGDFNDLLWNIEVEINNKKKSYKTVAIKDLSRFFRDAYSYITVCLDTDPQADNMIPVSEVFTLFRYEFNVLGFEELNDITKDIMSFMKTPSRYNSMISVNELRSIMGSLFNKLEGTTN